MRVDGHRRVTTKLAGAGLRWAQTQGLESFELLVLCVPLFAGVAVIWLHFFLEIKVTQPEIEQRRSQLGAVHERPILRLASAACRVGSVLITEQFGFRQHFAPRFASIFPR